MRLPGTIGAWVSPSSVVTNDAGLDSSAWTSSGGEKRAQPRAAAQAQQDAESDAEPHGWSEIQAACQRSATTGMDNMLHISYRGTADRDGRRPRPAARRPPWRKRGATS
jgi:hypothetical protein